MALTPDEWIDDCDDVSPTALKLGLFYCKCADSDTGEYPVSREEAMRARNLRSDHFAKYEGELIDKGWIRIIYRPDLPEGRIVKIAKGWRTRAERSRLKSVPKIWENTSRNSGESLPNLGSAPQTWEDCSQNLGESSQNLGGINRKPAHQPMTSPERESARETETVSTIYAAQYGHDPPIYGLERLAGVTDLAIWREVMVAWKSNGWRPNNFDAMAREYKQRAERQARNGRTNTHSPTTNTRTAERPAQQFKARRKL